MSRLRLLSSVRGCVSYTNFTKLPCRFPPKSGYPTYSTIIYAGVSKPWHPKKVPYKSHSAAPVKSMSLSRAQMYLDRHEKWRIQWVNPGKIWGKSPSLEVSSWENHPEWWIFQLTMFDSQRLVDFSKTGSMHEHQKVGTSSGDGKKSRQTQRTMDFGLCLVY